MLDEELEAVRGAGRALEGAGLEALAVAPAEVRDLRVDAVGDRETLDASDRRRPRARQGRSGGGSRSLSLDDLQTRGGRRSVDLWRRSDRGVDAPAGSSISSICSPWTSGGRSSTAARASSGVAIFAATSAIHVADRSREVRARAAVESNSTQDPRGSHVPSADSIAFDAGVSSALHHRSKSARGVLVGEAAGERHIQ